MTDKNFSHYYVTFCDPNIPSSSSRNYLLRIGKRKGCGTEFYLGATKKEAKESILGLMETLKQEYFKL